jgi:hypothetical protein
MCPACMATIATVAQIAVGAASASGLIAAVVAMVRANTDAKSIDETSQTSGGQHGSPANRIES